MMAAVFPDAAACLENIGGDREIPNHPLVQQTIHDCLDEAMDLPGLERVLQAILDGKITCTSRDTPEPSVLAHEILNAMPYQFLDDAPLEERRTQAVYTRRASEPTNANELGTLDRAAIARVADEAWPDVRDADELHDALLTGGYLTEVEGINARGESWMPLFMELQDAGRARRGASGLHLSWRFRCLRWRRLSRGDRPPGDLPARPVGGAYWRLYHPAGGHLAPGAAARRAGTGFAPA